MKLFLNWLLGAVAIIIVAYILPGVGVAGFFAAFVTALVLGLINTFIRPFIILLTLPINVLTLGLFTLVINALLIMLAGVIVPGFEVANFWWALVFGVVLWLVNQFFTAAKLETGQGQHRPNPPYQR